MAVSDPYRLLRTLCELPRETEWLEFKLNRFDADEVGQYISGLANAAIFCNEPHAYLVFGVNDKTHTIEGTKIRLKEKLVGNEIFEHWLARMLNPRIVCEFVAIDIDGAHVELIVIAPAYLSPVRFKSLAYIRVDSIQKSLTEYPERERAIWSITSRLTFERGIAEGHLTIDQVFEQFACKRLLEGLGVQKKSREAIIEQLLMEDMIVDDKQGGYDVRNLFVLLAAKDLAKFPLLARKAPRVIHYSKETKLEAVDDVTGRYGYAIAFQNLLAYIMGRIPHKEEMLHGMRIVKYQLPEISVREFVANALIHQDLTSTGDGPVIEIFSDKLRVTNPGQPLVSPDRFIDAPAKSRNEKLAGIMRRLGFCEERGSGIDRALDAIEKEILPPPTFQEVENSTVVTMFRARSFASMTKEERLRACYQHASLRFEAGSAMSNASLRKRFGLRDQQYPQVSQVIREAIDNGLIRPLDEDQAKRNARYLPYWA